MGKLANNSVDSRWSYYLSCASAANLAEKQATPTNISYLDGFAQFNGTSSYITLANQTNNLNIKTLRIIINYQTKVHIFLATGITITITGTTLNIAGLTSPSVYVNGLLVLNNTAGNISTGINDIVITTATRFNLIATTIGKNSTNYSNGSIQLFAASPYVFTKEEIELLYTNSLYKSLQFPLPENKQSCCFIGSTSAAYLESPIDSRFNFSDGSSDQPFWFAFNYESGFNQLNDEFIFCKENNAASNSNYRLRCLGAANAMSLYVYQNNNQSISCNTSFVLPKDKNHIIIGYDGRGGATAANGIYCYANGVQLLNGLAANNASYTNMGNNSNPCYFNKVSGARNTNKLYNFKIGSGTLTPQNITDIFNNVLIGTEIAHYPLSESGGNIRYNALGDNSLNLVLKGTTDGNYNVGYQNVYDYDSLVGGCTKVNYLTAAAYLNVPKLIWYVGSYNSQFIINNTVWAFAFRFNGVASANFSDQILNYFNSSNNPTYSFVILLGAVSSGYLGIFLSTNPSYFDGTLNTIAVPRVSIQDFQTHSIVTYIIGSNIHLVVDGSYKGYVTAAQILCKIQILRHFNQGSAYQNFQSGVFYDFRFWDGITLTQAEAQAFHLNSSMPTPTHAYSLLGDNGGKDLVGTLDLTKGVDIPEYTIPNKADNTCVLTTYQPVTPSSAIQVKRNEINEIIDLRIKNGIITEKYGKAFSNINNVEVFNEVQPAMRFKGDNYLDFGNILNAEVKDGFIIICWHKMLGDFTHGTNDIGLLSKYTSPLGFYTVDSYTLFHNAAKTPTVTNKGLRNLPCLSIFQVLKEKTHIYGFTDELKFKTTIETNFFIQDITTNLLVGKGLSTAINPFFKGLIYSVCILNGGLLTQQEAYQIWASEKNKYGL